MTKPRFTHLIFDLETNGLPENNHIPAEYYNLWPDIVQFAWVTVQKDGTLNKKCHLIQQKKPIPLSAEKIHGINTSLCKKLGKPLEKVLALFEKDVSESETLVAHNAQFDSSVIMASCYRLDRNPLLKGKKILCTMRSTTDLCQLPGKFGNKYPKLSELYHYLYRKKAKGLHDALKDVLCTWECLKKLQRNKRYKVTWKYYRPVSI